MSTEYQEVTTRFRQERKRLNLTQEEVSKKIYMTQGHYCKAEQGKKRFTYGELQSLTRTGVDLHYVYTGERLHHPEYYTFFANCGSEEAQCLTEMTLPLLLYILRHLPQPVDNDLYKRIKHEKCLLARNRNMDNYFFQLRRYASYTQAYMAGLLGIDVKKYAALEKNRRFGDSELLLRIYDQFGINPLIMLHAENGVAREICALLELLGEQGGQRIFAYIKHIYEHLLMPPFDIMK
ncbi:MAG: helix-turn-helix domain-containing protein [Candidatus Gastranaerophilales bacterium]|nr:helix-turn-helix domain-containing protein [Candidatus Gastranaerophilales bacterium]